MPPTLPRAFGRKFQVFGTLLIVVTACRHVTSDPAVKPGPPLPAQKETELETMDTECAGLIAALDRFGKCPNHEDGDREWVRQTIEVADQSFAAGKKSNPDEPSQKAIAGACRRATVSINFANERCLAGKRPRVD